MRFVLPLLLLLSLASCQPAPPSSKVVGAKSSAIIGGTKATALDAWAAPVVFIGSITSPAGLCSGTLIAKRVVLTAAHCVASGSKMKVTFQVGGASRSLDVERSLVHEEYRRTKNSTQNDLALLKLASDAPVEPALMGDTSPALIAATSFLAAGYGKSRDKFLPDDSERVLRSATLSLFRGKTVEGSRRDLIFVDQSQGAGVCSGDSGGPLYFRAPSGNLYLIGVAGYVTNPENPIQACSGYAAFHNLIYHQKWILKSLAAL